MYAGEFERTGFTGALNRYRNMDRDWEDLAAWDGAPIAQPSLFIGGERDADHDLDGAARSRRYAHDRCPASSASHVLDGCGHWIQQERPDEVNRLLVDWLEIVAERP